ncbi:hypothetical protein FGG78_30190 [Thioclava sp. BHET1]|nr:hypothetical protein FGG78_30190 [Thioclava sp. BHET1]
MFKVFLNSMLIATRLDSATHDDHQLSADEKAWRRHLRRQRAAEARAAADRYFWEGRHWRIPPLDRL